MKLKHLLIVGVAFSFVGTGLAQTPSTTPITAGSAQECLALAETQKENGLEAATLARNAAEKSAKEKVELAISGRTREARVEVLKDYVRSLLAIRSQYHVSKKTAAANYALVSGACSNIDKPDTAGISARLERQGENNVFGSATLRDTTEGLRVILRLSGQEVVGRELPAQLRSGTCSVLGPPRFLLDNVENGQSETTLNTTIAQLKILSPISVMVYNPDDISERVACADISL